MSKLLQSLADLIAGRANTDTEKLKSELAAEISRGTLAADETAIRAALATRAVDESQTETLAREILKAAVTTPPAEPEEPAPDELDDAELEAGEEIVRELLDSVQAVRKSVDAITAALPTIGGALAALLTDSEKTGQEVTLLKSEIAALLQTPAPGQPAPVERAAAAQPNRDDVDLILKANREGRNFGSVAIGHLMKTGELSGEMQSYLREIRKA